MSYGNPLTFSVVADSTGRGHIRPFGTYGAKHAGAMVTIGDKRYKVTSDGRVNIPKAIMDRYGITNSDGRKVINIQFGTRPGKDYWKDVKAIVKKPLVKNKDIPTGRTVKRHRISRPKDNRLKPRDSGDINWSSE